MVEHICSQWVLVTFKEIKGILEGKKQLCVLIPTLLDMW